MMSFFVVYISTSFTHSSSLSNVSLLLVSYTKERTGNNQQTKSIPFIFKRNQQLFLISNGKTLPKMYAGEKVEIFMAQLKMIIENMEIAK